MGAPVTSGLTVLNAMTSTSGLVVIQESGASCTLSASAGTIRALDTSTGSGIFGVRVPFSSVDFTGQLLSYGMRRSVGTLASFASGGVRIRLYSNSGLTEYAEWILSGAASLPVVITSFVLDPANTSLRANATAGFSITTIQAVEFRALRDPAQTANADIFVSQLGRLSAISITDGVGSPATFNDFTNINWRTTNTSITRFNTGQYQSNVPLRIGNASTQTAFAESLPSVIFAAPSDSSSNPAYTIYDAGRVGLEINTASSDSTTLTLPILNGLGGGALVSQGSGTINISGGGFSRMSLISLSRGTYNVTFNNCARVRLLGADISRSVIESTTSTLGAIEVTNLVNCNIDNCTIRNNTLSPGVLFNGVTGSKTLTNVTFSGNTTDIRATNLGGGTLTLTLSGGTFPVTSSTDGSGTLIVQRPAVTFTAGSLATSTFNNVRCRLSLVPGGETGVAFTSSDVNATANTITLSGLNGKINTDTVIRVDGLDLPLPLTSDRVYYVAGGYTSGNTIQLSSTPGGSPIDLTDVGSGSMQAVLFTQLDLSLITSGAYTVNLTTAATAEGVTLANGDILCLQAMHWAGTPQTVSPATASKYLEKFIQYQGSSISDLSVLETDIYHNLFSQALGTDGSLTDEFSLDAGSPGRIQIVIDDADAITRTDRGYLFYCYVQWSFVGMQILRGQIEAESENKLLINGDLTLRALQKTRILGPYISRADGDFLGAEDSELIEWQFSNQVGYTITQEVPVNLSTDVLAMIQGTLSLVSAIATGTGSSGGSGGGGLTQADVRTALGMASANLDTQLSSIKSDSSAIKTQTDKFTFTGSDVKATLDGEKVTVQTNEDKSGYSLTQSFPTNFSLLSINGTGQVVSSNFVAAPSTSSIADAVEAKLTDEFAAIPGQVWSNVSRTITDKTGFSLTQTFPTNFSLLSIDGTGRVIASNFVAAPDVNSIATAVNNVLSDDFSALSNQIGDPLQFNEYTAPPSTTAISNAVSSSLSSSFTSLSNQIGDPLQFNEYTAPIDYTTSLNAILNRVNSIPTNPILDSSALAVTTIPSILTGVSNLLKVRVPTVGQSVSVKAPTTSNPGYVRTSDNSIDLTWTVDNNGVETLEG